MNFLKRWFPIADMLSVMRAALAVWMVLYAYSRHWDPNWAAVFCLWAAGWATDILDGWVARRRGSLRDRWPMWDSDGIADSLLALAGTVVLLAYAYGHWWDAAAIAVMYIYLISWLAAIVMVGLIFSSPSNELTSIWIGANMLLGHAIIQIGFTSLWLAYMAGGFGPALVTLATLLTAGFIQRHKIALWMDGRLQPTLV